MGVPPLTIPSNLALSVAKWGDERLRDWLARLPTIVDELADRWSLRTSAPFEPGGDCAWVAPVRDSAGQSLVLKVGFRHVESEHEAAGLLEWGGDGAVLLHDAIDDDDTLALLLEACDPGTELGRQEPEDKQDEIVAGLLRRLWREPSDGPSVPAAAARCATNGPTSTPPSPTKALDPGIARDGLSLFRDLAAYSAISRCCCLTDLHAGNILAARREPWLVIDPKPYVGDPCYDVTQHLLNCQERLTRRPRRAAPAGWQIWPSSTRTASCSGCSRAACRSRPAGRGWPTWRDDSRPADVGQDARSGRPGNGTLPPRHAAARTAASRRPPIASARRRRRQRRDRVGPHGGEPFLEQGGQHDGVVGRGHGGGRVYDDAAATGWSPRATDQGHELVAPGPVAGHRPRARGSGAAPLSRAPATP